MRNVRWHLQTKITIEGNWWYCDFGGMSMRFRIFGWHELAYKWIALVVTVALTTCSIKWSLEHQTDQFTVSIIFALFLFGVGIYITNMSSMVQNEFYRRKEQYLNMRNLRVVFALEKLDSFSDSLKWTPLSRHRFYSRCYENVTDFSNSLRRV